MKGMDLNALMKQAAEMQAQLAKAQEEAMKHVLPFKQCQIEQSRLEAEAAKAARIKAAEGGAEARRIEAIGEAEARQKLADAEAYRVERVGKANAEQMAREGALLSRHPLLVQKTLADKLSSRVQVIIAPPPVDGGFIGSTKSGATTTLGRNGSDYSAAILGACLGAGEIQIWTDVDGLLTADPRIIPQPRLVPRLSFAEAAELAYFGAKVLHPSTIHPAVERNIPVRILNARKPDGTGTLITADAVSSGNQPTAMAAKRDITVPIGRSICSAMSR